MSRLFGTDGVRGIANTELTPELAFQLGRAAARVLATQTDPEAPFVVGRDTRISGTMLEGAIIAGVTSAGRDAVSVGILPTAAVAIVTRRTNAAAGCMISASHNPIADNGIKFFSSDGFKLSDESEQQIEDVLADDANSRPTGTAIGIARIALNLGAHYYDALYEHAGDLSGLTVVVDAAFGAAYAIAPYVLRKLGATVHELNCEADGARINVDCGATDLGPLRQRVRELIERGEERVIGVAYDGDADRAQFVDETGSALNGDHVLLILAQALHRSGDLAGDGVVGTVMSNFGLEEALKRNGIRLVRAPVGDRYVLEAMRTGGYLLGGEQSGHIIDLRRNTTGDGPMTTVTLLSLLTASEMRLHDAASQMQSYPQILLNVAGCSKETLRDPSVAQSISHAEQQLGANGRILVRASGTEPVVRIMVEGKDQSQIDRLAQGLATEVAAASGRVRG
ncbi:MAG: phosphoglucosamine mutase [Candidatus Eremiobacteraeota bacterium]|nr:phosphoglucosamine mutase [Candidatus Eremiobacteraeota bacterium]